MSALARRRVPLAHRSGHGDANLRLALAPGSLGRGCVQMSEAVGDSRRSKRCVCLAALCGVALTLVACSHSKPAPAEGMWDPKAAAAYLDRRMQWWIGWQTASRDHGTFCFSCHTVVPYALARPALRAKLGETTATGPERQLMDDVKR